MHTYFMVYTALIYVTLVALSFVFSAAETSYSSLRVTLIRLQASKGISAAQRVLRLAHNLPHTLNAIIIGDNVINLAFTSLATYAGYITGGALGALGFSAANLIVVFVISEAWPKNMAVNNPEGVALLLAPLMEPYVSIMDAPATALGRLGRSMASMFTKHNSRKNLSTEERMVYALELAKLEGVITPKQYDVINRVLKFDDLTAGELMVPLERCPVTSPDSTIKEAMELFTKSGLRRIPVLSLPASKSADYGTDAKLVGALYVRDVTVLFARGYTDTSALEVVEPAVTVEASEKLINVFSKMQSGGAQVAGISNGERLIGFLFISDLLEAAVGEAFPKNRALVYPGRFAKAS
jgi:CBS domain containing-hemolysin-like protein